MSGHIHHILMDLCLCVCAEHELQPEECPARLWPSFCYSIVVVVVVAVVERAVRRVLQIESILGNPS